MTGADPSERDDELAQPGPDEVELTDNSTGHAIDARRLDDVEDHASD